MTNLNMTLREVKETLSPRGDSDSVVLQVGTLVFSKAEIDAAIADIAKLEAKRCLGYPVSNLEKIGIMTLLRAAGAA
jgi:hypothetical protein